MSIRVDELVAMDVEEFGEELENSLGDLIDFDAFLDRRVNQRTKEWLTDRRDHVDADLMRYKNVANADKDWEGRAGRWRNLLSNRIHMVAARNHEDKNRWKLSGRNAEVRGWKNTLHAIIDLVDRYGDDDLCAMVEDVKMPFGDVDPFQ